MSIQWKVALAGVDFDQQEHDAVSTILTHRWLSMGDETHSFEKEFAAYMNVKHAIAVGNCTQALHLAYRALGAGEGTEILVPSLTFVASVNTILQCGATPVFVDITSANDLNMSVDDLRRKITPRTRMISILHYGGYPANMDAIRDLGRQYDLRIVEDAAHAVGGSLGGVRCGAIGDIGCFSFFSNKNMTTGEGGMITTQSDDLAAKMRLYRSHGMTSLSWDRHQGLATSYDVVEAGYNCRIDEVRSAIGRVQLRKLDGFNAKRRELVMRYIRNLNTLGGVTIPFRDASWHAYPTTPSYHIFPILIDQAQRKQGLVDHLKNEGIQTSMHYPPIHKFSYYEARIPSSLPVTEGVASRLITLPLHTGMTADQVDWITSVIIEFLK